MAIFNVVYIMNTARTVFVVGLRDAKLSRIWNSDYCIRIHRAHEDSGQRKLKGLVLQLEMPLSIAVLQNGNIFHDKSDKEI